MPKVDSDYICLSVILIDFVLSEDETYYPQVLSKEFIYIEKRKKRWLGILLLTLIPGREYI